MATPNVKVVVGLDDKFTAGAGKILGGLKEMQSGVLGLRTSMYALQTAMGFMAGGAFFKGFVDTAAGMEKTKKMLEGISGSAQMAEKDFQWLLKFGEKNAAVLDLETLQKAFVKLKVAGLDPTNGSLQAIVDGIAAFGGSAQNFELAVLAIFQSLSKGTISAEEMRRQLGEQMPTAIKIMARELGLAEEKFIKLMETGQLKGPTARQAINAMLAGMANDFRGAADRMGETWSGLMGKLAFRWKMFQSQVMEYDVFRFLKGKLEEFFAFMDSPEGKQRINDFAKRLAIGFLNAADAVLQMGKNLALVLEQMAKMADYWDKIPSTVKGAAAGGLLTRSPWGAGIGGAIGLWNDKESLGEGFANWFGRMVDRRPGSELNYGQGGAGSEKSFFKQLADDIEKGTKALQGQNSEMRQEIINQKELGDLREKMAKLGGKEDPEAKKIRNAYEKYNELLDQINVAFKDATGSEKEVWIAKWEKQYNKIKADLADAQRDGVSAVRIKQAEAQLEATDKLTRKVIEAGFEDMKQLQAALQEFKDEYAALGSGNKKDKTYEVKARRNEKLVASGFLTQDEADAYNAKLREQIDADARKKHLESIRAFYQEYWKISEHGYEAINEMIKEQAQVFRDAKISEVEIAEWAERKKLEYAKDWKSGVKLGIKEYIDDVENGAKAAKQAFAKMASAMEDAIVEFVKTGKLSFSNFIDSMISDLIRLAAKKYILAPFFKGVEGLFDSVFGGGGSGAELNTVGDVGSGIAALSSGNNATGGNVYAGRVYGVGESGKEWFVPSVDGRIIPQSALTGAAGGGGTSVIVHNYSSSKSTTRETSDGRGGRTIEVIVGEAVASELKRNGSAPNQALRQNFGARNQLVTR